MELSSRSPPSSSGSRGGDQGEDAGFFDGGKSCAAPFPQETLRRRPGAWESNGHVNGTESFKCFLCGERLLNDLLFRDYMALIL